MSGNAARLYDEDFVRWTEEQAAALREAAGLATNLPLDWENLAEEIDSLGRSQSRELRSRIAVVVEHLIKLENSPAIDPRPVGSRRSTANGEISRICSRQSEPQERSCRHDRARNAPDYSAGRPQPANHGETNPETIARIEGTTPRSKYSATGFLGTTLSPPAGRGSSDKARERGALYPRCFLKKAVTGS